MMLADVGPRARFVIAPVRRTLWSIALVAAALAVLASPAHGGKSCAQQVIDDWFDNSRVDGVYPARCYRAAIAALPEDVRSYSSAEDDIKRALQQRLRDRDEGGSSGGGSGGTSSGTDSGGSSSDASRESAGSGSGGSNSGGSADGDGKNEKDAAPPSDEQPSSTVVSPSSPGPEVDAAGDGAVAAPAEELFNQNLDDGSGSSVPLPVIVLLVALGIAAAAVVAKLALRHRGRPGGGPPGPPGPGSGA
jgi:hypothetical protein